jgi:hypothetical protein
LTKAVGLRPTARMGNVLSDEKKRKSSPEHVVNDGRSAC